MPFKTTIARFVAGIVLIAATAYGDEVKVMTSGAFTAAYLEIVPEFERATRNTVVTAFGASMGNAPDSIPSRLQRGEPVDVVIVADSAVARGDAEIGFQQISELLPVPGIDYVGPLPPEVQKVTVFSAGIASSSKHPEAARALIRFLASPAVVPAIRKSGLEPVTSEQQNEHHAVQEPGAATQVRRAPREGKDLERNLRGMESRNRRQETAGACEA